MASRAGHTTNGAQPGHPDVGTVANGARGVSVSSVGDQVSSDSIFGARPSSAMSGMHGGLASFHGGAGGGSNSSGSSIMGSPFTHVDAQSQIQQLQQMQQQQHFQLFDANSLQQHEMLQAGMYGSHAAPQLQAAGHSGVHQASHLDGDQVAGRSNFPGMAANQYGQPEHPGRDLQAFLQAQQQFALSQQQSHFGPPFQPEYQIPHAQHQVKGRIQSGGSGKPATEFGDSIGPQSISGGPSQGPSQNFTINQQHQASHRKQQSGDLSEQTGRWPQNTASFGVEQISPNVAQMGFHTQPGAFNFFDERTDMTSQQQMWQPQAKEGSFSGRHSDSQQGADLQHRGSMDMHSSLPHSSLMPHFMSKFNGGQQQLDLTDHNLSNALANNAHISGSSDTLRLQPPQSNSTPTIPEEDEETFHRHQTATFAPPGSQRQQSNFSSFNVGQNNLANAASNHSSVNMSMSLPLHTQPVAQHNLGQTMGYGQGMQADAASVTLARRSRPNLRPTTYQQYTNLNMNALEEQQLRDTEDCLPYIDEIIFNYLSTPSRLGLGERTVMVMTSKVAQKSYGAEKRFLCPPPMVLLVGSSWWSACKQSAASFVSSQTGGGIPLEDNAPTVLTPPRLSISMSGDGAAPPQDGLLEWATSNGKLIDTDNPSSEFAISGRSIGRQLFINDSDEKRRHCEALVHLTVPAAVSSNRRPLGVFSSKPIKVISKPSKKRQSTRNSELGVNHGSTISLFHRLRSQTVSTRYLCVSGAPTWFKGSDGNPFLNTDSNTHIPNQSAPPSCFVAKTSSWDPFIVYLVDPHMNEKDASGNTQQQHAANQKLAADGRPAHYPSPPVNSLPFAQGNTPIHYNQPVVLQCLNTAVVSPVMVIRKADRGTTVVGGGDPLAPFGPGGPPPGDSYGEPVSQLHKIAFEVLEEGGASNEVGGPGQSGHFLGCLNEDVGLRKPISGRQWSFGTGLGNFSTAIGGGSSNQSRPVTPTTPVTPMVGHAPGSFDSFKLDLMMSPTASGYAAPHSRMTSAGTSAGPSPYASTPAGGGSIGRAPYSDQSSDGGKAKRPRRVSSSSLMQQKERAGGSSKGRRRGQSLSVIGLQNQMQVTNVNAATAGFTAGSQLSSSASMSAIPLSQQQAGAGHAIGGGMPASASDALLRRTSSFANSLSNSDTSSFNMSAGLGPMTWSVEVHDSDVWTIVGVDIARHTFYLPPTLIGGAKAKADGVDASIAHLVTVPAPQRPITPLPVVLKYSGGTASKGLAGRDVKPGDAVINASASSNAAGANAKQQSHVILTGMNLTPDLFIYFGDWRSTHVSVINSRTIYCAPPPPLDEVGLPRDLVPIILVRRDGVIFPTDCIYQP